MKRISNTLLGHDTHKTAHRSHHHRGIAGLYRYHHIVELLITAYAKELHTRLDHSRRRITVAAHYAVAERTMIDSYTYRTALSPADVKKSHKTLAKTFQFIGIFGISVFQLFECPRGVYIISRVHTYFVGIHRSSIGYSRIEMHICHKGYIASALLELCLDIAHVDRLAVTLCCKAHYLAALCHDAQYLLHTAIGVHGACICHGLDADRIGATDSHTTHINLNRCATRIVEEVYISLSCTHTATP